MAIWYAVLTDNNDNDWGTGSFDKDSAVRVAASYRESGYPDAHIAVISNDTDNPVCIDVITDLEAYHVKPEFFSMWGEDVDENSVITLDEVKRLADEWNTSTSDLLDQLIEI